MKPDLEDILAKNNLRITKPRQIVFQILFESSEPVTIAHIYNQAKLIDRTSVYRTLELFNRLAIIHIIYVGWKKRYELAYPFKAHHHHLQCDNCGKVYEISSDKLESFINDLAGEYEFKAFSHSFEINGLCRTCINISK